MREAKQIIFFDEEKKIKFNKKEFESILNQKNVKELPIVILSVIGALRTGKSFLLSWLVRYFNTGIKNSEWIKQYENEEKLSQFFKWRSGSTSETQGIWAWSEVFIVNGSSGEKVGVLLIDTQGLFDSKNTTKQNGNIFTLSTLISSIQIFNLRSAMQEDNLECFKVFSEYGRLVALATNSCVTNPFQRVVFLIRDWPYPNERSFGSHGGKNYIDDYLRVNEKNKGTELGERRQQIRKLFSKVDCYLMPKPGEKIETDESDSFSRLSDMNKNFTDHLGELPTFLFPNGAVEQSKLVAGAPVLAGDIAENVEDYVNLLNSDDNLSPQSMFQAMAKIRNTTLARDAKKEYKTFVTCVEENMETFLTDEEIQMKHSEAKKKALHYFEKQQMRDVELNPEILNELNKDIKDEFDNWKIRNERAKDKIQTFNGKALEEAIPRYSFYMDEWSRADPNHPFVTLEQINQKHSEIQEKIANDLRSYLKGRDKFTNPFLIQLPEKIEKEFGKWKTRNEQAKDEIIKSNEIALKDGKTLYRSSMEDWTRGATCFASLEQINKTHLEIQEEIRNGVKTNLKGPNEITKECLNKLQEQIDDKFQKWKTRYERDKDGIMASNEVSLREAEKMYISSMEDWIKGKKLFANPEKLAKQNEDIQKIVESHLKNQLKGPSEIPTEFMTRIQTFMQDYFKKQINPKNERKRILIIGAGVASGATVAVGGVALAVAAVPVAIVAGAAAGTAALSSTGIAATVKHFKNKYLEESPPDQD